MSTPSEPQQTASGRDLARQALAAYKATAKAAPARKQPARRHRADYGSGRDPVPYAAAIGSLNAEQGWAIALEGGNILDRWADLCPELVGMVG